MNEATKSMEYKKDILAKAGEVKTADQLLTLIKEIENYDHDYNTIVDGCFAAMLAAFNVVNRSPRGGITGFQAGCLGWSAVEEFMGMEKDAPKKILDYGNLLFPQYEEKFLPRVSKDTAEWVKNEAQKKLDAPVTDKDLAPHPNVKAHWQKLASGWLPASLEVH